MASVVEARRAMDPEVRRKIDEVLARYRGQKGVLIQVLHEVQEFVGYLPREVQEYISEATGAPLSEVYSIVTFYALFSLKPKGKYQVGVCKGTACYVRGAEKILAKVQETLGVKPGDTTEDGRFSLQVMRCMGACGLGPVIVVNKDIYARLKPDKVPAVIGKYR